MNAWLLYLFTIVVLVLLVLGLVWAVKLPYRPLGLGDEEVLSKL